MNKYDLVVNNRGVAHAYSFGHFERVAALVGFGSSVVPDDLVTLSNGVNSYRVRKSDIANNAIIKFIKLNDLTIM